VIFKMSLPSVREKALGKELLRRVFSFTKGFLCGTRQRAYLPSAEKKHSVKYLAFGKEPNFGSDRGSIILTISHLSTRFLFST
jgi:hypothetical protein